jgi:hypothetical protein
MNGQGINGRTAGPVRRRPWGGRGLAAVRVAVGLGLALLAGVPAAAQTATATTGVVQGTIRDSSGGVMPGVTVVLTDLNTNTARETVTAETGFYAFSNLLPGRYRLTATLPGFQQAVVSDVAVEVNRTQAVDLRLGVGQVTEAVEVVGGAAAALQQNDSTVLNTMSQQTVLRLPNPTRSLEAIQFNQPLAVPYMGGDSNRTRAGAIAGARTDQNTYTLDGADVSDNVVGDNFLEALPAAVVPLPTESVEEFSAATTNANATFGRGSGGQFVIVTKRGTNAYRGSSYWYLQNDSLNALSWNQKRLGLDKPPLENNRGGFSLGGPIIRNRTFFFTNYEAQRFPRSTQVERLVPSDSLRAGVLRFRDAAGNVVPYDLRTIDPRGIGLNPVVSAVWDTLPAGNDPSRGDGLNTVGFTGDADTSFNSDTVVLRLDHNFKQQLADGPQLPLRQHPGVGRRAGRHRRPAAGQRQGAAGRHGGPAARAAVRGDRRDRTGQPELHERDPRLLRARLHRVHARGSVPAGVEHEHRARHRRRGRADERHAGRGAVTGGQRAHLPVHQQLHLDAQQPHRPVRRHVAARILVLPAQRAAGRIADRAGGAGLDRIARQHPRRAASPDLRRRRPRQLPASPPDVNSFSQLFAGSLGLVNNVSVLGMRDSSLAPLPIGTPQEINTITDGLELYVADTWRVGPQFTLNLGVSYQVRLSPKEEQDRYAFLIDAGTNEVLDSATYLSRARAAAEAGSRTIPTLAFQPLSSSGRDQYYRTDWSNLGPRLAATWSPQYEGGFLGRLLARDKTVLRGGYALVFDRTNSVQQILAMGMGYGENLSVLGPRCNAAGTPGANCTPGGADPLAAFRVGVDGPVPTPVQSQVTAPILAQNLTITVLADTEIKTGRTHSFNFSYQRELPWQMVLESGAVLRLGRQLPQAWVMSSVPYFHRDPQSGQTLAQAYDAIAGQLRDGVPAGSVTPQPWFENLVGSGQSTTLAAQQATAFIDGNLSGLWLQINNRRIALGQQPLSNSQIQTLWARGDGGESLYQAVYASIRRRAASGLSMSASYTLSRALDQGGRRQNSIGAQSSGFNPDIDWGPADFDRRHVLNLTGVYDLPFRQNGPLSRLTGGWYVAGIFAASSGVPLDVCQRAGVFGGGLAFTGCVGAIPTGPRPSTGVNDNVTGSDGVGTTGNPATGGTGLNLFADPKAAYDSYRRVLISQDDRAGRATIRGLPRWNLDLSIGKRTQLTGRVHGVFTAEIVNVFNSLQYSNPSLNLAAPASFGVITSQANTPRQVQLGFRVEF